MQEFLEVSGGKLTTYLVKLFRNGIEIPMSCRKS